MINASDSLLSQFSHQFSHSSVLSVITHIFLCTQTSHFSSIRASLFSLYTLSKINSSITLSNTLFEFTALNITVPSIQKKKIAFRYTLSIVTTPNVISTLQSCFCFSIIGAPLFHTLCQIITADSVTISPSLFARQISNLWYITSVIKSQIPSLFYITFSLSISLLQTGHFNIQVRIFPSQSHYCCKKFVSYFHLDFEMAPGTAQMDQSQTRKTARLQDLLFHPRPRLDRLLLRPPAICSLHQGRSMRKRTLD